MKVAEHQGVGDLRPCFFFEGTKLLSCSSIFEAP